MGQLEVVPSSSIIIISSYNYKAEEKKRPGGQEHECSADEVEKSQFKKFWN